MTVAERVEKLMPPVQSVPSCLAFSKKKNLGWLREEFDRVLNSMKKDGHYDKIVASYFGTEKTE